MFLLYSNACMSSFQAILVSLPGQHSQTSQIWWRPYMWPLQIARIFKIGKHPWVKWTFAPRTYFTYFCFAEGNQKKLDNFYIQETALHTIPPDLHYSDVCFTVLLVEWHLSLIFSFFFYTNETCAWYICCKACWKYTFITGCLYLPVPILWWLWNWSFGLCVKVFTL